jgi:membrane associated rhomboid family serine protease
MLLTYFIIGVTAFVSIAAFNNASLIAKLQFNAAHIIHRKEYFRLVTHAFVHAGWWHLIVNMMVLFFFGRNVETYLGYYFGNKGTFFFLLLYFGGILASNGWALIKHRNNYYYNAVGASGAVSAVLFAFIFFDPWEPIYLFGVISIPGILFAAGYLIYSYIASKRENDNIAHDAHFLGALFGFIFPVLLKPGLFEEFIDKLFRLI